MTALLPLLACTTPDPIRDLEWTNETVLLLVQGDGSHRGGARFPAEHLSFRELEDWLREQALARERIEAVAAGVRRDVLQILAAEIAREFGVQARILDREHAVVSSPGDRLDPRANFERYATDGLLVVSVAVRELDEGGAGSAALEAVETAAMYGAGKAVSQFHSPSEASYVLCAVRRGDAWVQAIEPDCAATMAARVLASLRAARPAPAPKLAKPEPGGP